MKRSKNTFATDRFNGQRNWFPQARFGLFVHFGLYALTGENENTCRNTIPRSEYEKMMDRFNPVRFNANEWVDLAKASGVKYLVLTAKHGEGFCLWDSAYTRYKITNTPFRRDLLKELAAACRRRQMRLGLYFSSSDWHYQEPGEGKKEALTYPGYVEVQLRELLTKYGPIACVWFDSSDPRLDDAFIIRMKHMIRKLQAGAVVNDRGLNSWWSAGKSGGDYVTPERFIPDAVDARHSFIEACDAMGRHSWGYCVKENFWSTPALIRRLSRMSSFGGNYLLNVEPAPDGVIRPECAERLRSMGHWLRVNGEAVFGTKECRLFPLDPGLLHKPRIGVATIRDRDVYLHLHRWIEGDTVLVPHLSGNIAGATLLGSAMALRGSSCPDGISITGLPDQPPNPSVSIVKIRFKAPPEIALKTIRAKRNRTIEIIPGETVHLSPEDARISAGNGVPLQHLNRFPNGRVSMGSLYRLDAELVWNITARKSEHYEVVAELGANDQQKDAVFTLGIAGHKLTGVTVFTGGWTKPKRLLLGRLDIPKGKHQFKFKIVEMPHHCFPDIYDIILRHAS